MASRCEVEEEESARSLAVSPRREFGKCIDLDFNLLPTPSGGGRRSSHTVKFMKARRSFFEAGDSRACEADGFAASYPRFQIAFRKYFPNRQTDRVSQTWAVFFYFTLPGRQKRALVIHTRTRRRRTRSGRPTWKSRRTAEGASF